MNLLTETLEPARIPTIKIPLVAVSLGFLFVKIDMSIRDAATMKSYILSKIRIDKKGCWNWTGSLIKGYGRVCVNNIIGVKGKKSHRVHRVSAALFMNFDLKSKLLVCHSCDNSICINPKHLFTGSQADNMRDKTVKNRQAKGSSHGRAKLTENDVKKIRDLLKHDTSKIEIAKRFRISRYTIRKIEIRKLWKHI